MQVSDIRLYEPSRSLAAATRASSDSSSFGAIPPQRAGDRAQIRTRMPRKAPKVQPVNLALGWAALAACAIAVLLALAFGQLGGALGLILGWLSAAAAFSARRELMILLDRALR